MQNRNPFALILALDVSLTSTGWAVWHLREDQPRAVGAIPTFTRGLDRYRDILRRLDELRQEYEPQLVIFEGYPYFLFGMGPGGQPARTNQGEGPGNQVFGLAGITEMIKMKVHFQWGLPFACLSPSSIKYYATGYGKAKKLQMIHALYDEHGVKFRTDDEVDAWWIAQMARSVLNREKETSEARRSAINSVLKSNDPEGTFDWVTGGWHRQLFGRAKPTFRRRKRSLRLPRGSKVHR